MAFWTSGSARGVVADESAAMSTVMGTPVGGLSTHTDEGKVSGIDKAKNKVKKRRATQMKLPATLATTSRSRREPRRTRPPAI